MTFCCCLGDNIHSRNSRPECDKVEDEEHLASFFDIWNVGGQHRGDGEQGQEGRVGDAESEKQQTATVIFGDIHTNICRYYAEARHSFSRIRPCKLHPSGERNLRFEPV